MKRLNDSRKRCVLIGFVAAVVLGGGSAKADFTFGEVTNLGPPVNSLARDYAPTISADGLSLYFDSNRPGGLGDHDIWQAPIIPIIDLKEESSYPKEKCRFERTFFEREGEPSCAG